MRYLTFGLTNFQCTIAFTTMMVRLPQKRLSTRTIPLWGRVNTFCAPPHTVSSLKNHIIKSEDVSGHAAQLFEEEGSESAMNDSDVLTLLSDTFPSSLLFKETPERLGMLALVKQCRRNVDSSISGWIMQALISKTTVQVACDQTTSYPLVHTRNHTMP